MADTLTGKLIKNLPEASSVGDTDIMLVENTTNTQKITWGTIASLIKAKLGIGTASELTTTSKEIVGAVNELNSNLIFMKIRYGRSWGEPSTVTIDNLFSKTAEGFVLFGTNVFNSSKGCIYLISTNGITATQFQKIGGGLDLDIARSGNDLVITTTDNSYLLFSALRVLMHSY